MRAGGRFVCQPQGPATTGSSTPEPAPAPNRTPPPFAPAPAMTNFNLSEWALPPVAGALLHRRAGPGRTVVLPLAGAIRGPALHLQGHGDQHLMARRDHRRGERADHRKDREEAAGTSADRLSQELRTSGRIADHRDCQKTRWNRNTFPSCGTRYARRSVTSATPCHRHTGALLQRRIRRHLRQHLRPLRRGLQRRPAQGLRRTHQLESAARPTWPRSI